MANIPGATNILPGVVTDVVTDSRGLSLGGGLRIAALIGEGSTDETVVSSALGGGLDGLNSSYTSTTGADGRHFQLKNYPLISNRTSLYKNGVKLTGLESTIDSNAFSYKYDYRIDISTGRIELQKAHLVDQGGAYYVALSTNVGLGTVDSLELLDANAPNETWTLRCVSVQRDVNNEPIASTAKFLAFGSVSGAKLDANGNPVVWIANGQVVNNGILKFGISETEVMSVAVSPFREGDGFTVKVSSGVLSKNDTLTANLIPEANINDPLLLQGLDEVVQRHGTPSTSNNLSLGCQLAFANSAPEVLTLQAAPTVPRRTSYLLADAVNATSTDNDDFIFPLPVGVTPDTNSEIHFFVTNPATSSESQILPNKLEFYTLGESGYPTQTQFIQDNTPAPGGYAYYYTVIQSSAAIATGFDGYIARNIPSSVQGIFSSESYTFDSSYIGKTLKVIDATNVANNGDFTVTSVSNGKLYFSTTSFDDFTTESSIAFQVIDPTTNLPLDSATDGNLTAIVSTATATLSSNVLTGVDFSTITNLTSQKLKITGTTTNNGLYDITSYDSLTNTITIEKAFVIETGLRFEVLDTSDVSNYVVINKNVVTNGFALRVTLVDSKDASFYDSGWINALAELEKVNCDILVPLPKATYSIVAQNALSHCRTMSNIRNKKERVLFAGALNGLTPENLTGEEDAAVEDIGILEGIQGDSVTEVLAGNIEDLSNYSVPDAFGTTFRCVYFYPDQIVVSAGGSNVLLDGFYIAAAAAGYMAGNPRIEMPLTNKVLGGFTILRDKLFSNSTLEKLAEAGVTVLQPVQGGGRVIWGVTTTQSGYPEEEEISIVFIRDRLAKTLRSAFAGFIGLPEDLTLQATLQNRLVNVMNSFVTQGLITKYADPTVKRDSVDPTQWNLSVKVQPTYPVNFIYVRVSVGTIS